MPKVSKRIGEIRKRIEYLLAITDVYPERKAAGREVLKGADSTVQKSSRQDIRISSSLKRTEKYQQEILKLEDISRQVDMFEELLQQNLWQSFLNML